MKGAEDIQYNVMPQVNSFLGVPWEQLLRRAEESCWLSPDLVRVKFKIYDNTIEYPTTKGVKVGDNIR